MGKNLNNLKQILDLEMCFWMMLILPDFKHCLGGDVEALTRVSEDWLCIEVVQKATDTLSSFGEQEGAGGE